MSEAPETAVVPFMTVQRSQTINMLRNWLREAEEGELIEVAAAFITKDRAVRTGASSSEDIARLCGAVEMLRERVMEEWKR
jgi:hypothetical protein